MPPHRPSTGHLMILDSSFSISFTDSPPTDSFRLPCESVRQAILLLRMLYVLIWSLPIPKLADLSRGIERHGDRPVHRLARV